MKKIIVGAVIVILGAIVLLQAMKLRSLRPAEDYEYAFRSDVDAGYFDQSALRDYHATGYEVG